MSDQVGRLYVLFDADGKPYIKGLRDLDRETGRAGAKMQSDWEKFGTKAGQAVKKGMAVAAAAVVAATAAIGVASVKAAATFEFEMSRIKANANGTVAEMKKLESTVIDLGKKTAFSAGETAQAANELVKAGLTLGETMEALPGMLDLAAAGELGVAQAAELTANTLSQFTLKVGDAAMVADVLANAANKSTTGVTEIGQSLENVATISANMGWTLQETSAALALLANNGVKGAEAGTSLKSMLMQLMTPTEAAATMMERYGVSLYDANGESVTAEVLLERLEKAFVGLSDADRDLAAGTIFGSYGIKAANILIKEGADAFADMTKEVSESGAAQDIAATKMDNLAGSYEQLKGSIETAAIMMGTEGIPGLRELVDGLTEETNAFVETWEKMTGTDAWKRGGFEVKLGLAVDTIGATLVSLGEKAVDTLTGVDWGPVATTITDAIGVAIEKAPPWVVEVVLDVVKDATTSPDVAKGMLKYGWLPSLVYQWGKNLGEGGDAERQSYLYNTNRGQYEAEYGSKAEQAAKLAAAERELGEETERAWIQQQKQEHALEASKKAAEEYADAVETMASDIGEAADYTEENLSKIGDALNAVAEESTATWEKAGGDLDQYIEDLQAQYDAIANASENIKAVMQTLGESGALAEFAAKGWNPDAVQNILLEKITAEPEILEALVGADPDTVEEVIQKWMNLIWQESEGQKRVMLDEQASLGEEGAESFERSFNRSIEGSNAMSDAIEDALDVDASGKARETALSYVRGWASALLNWNPLRGVSGEMPGSYGAGSTKPSKNIPVGLYDSGGDLPPGLTLALNATGKTESVVTGDLTSAMEDLVANLEASLENDQTLADAMIAAFSERSSMAGSFISRESSRYSMYEAQGAPTELLERTLMDQIRFIEEAVWEAQAQLDAAKANKLPQDTINDLAESLFDLKADAANARRELEELAKVPLENAARRWGMALSQTQEMMNLLSYSSDAYGLQSALFPTMMGQMGGSYQSSLDLMNSSTSYEDIMGYGSDALSTLSHMFDAEVGMLNQGVQKATDVIYSAQSEWESAWNERGQTIQDSYDAQMKTLVESDRELSEKYNQEIERVRDMQGELQSLWREQDRNARIGDLRSERANILAQGYYTEADVRRLAEIEDQIAEQQKQAARDKEMERLQAQVERLEQQRAEEAEELAQKQEAIQQQYELQLQAHQKEWEEQQAHYEQLLADAEAARQSEVDLLVLKYQEQMQTVMNQEAMLLGEEAQFMNAGRTLGEAFARGLLASIDSIASAAEAAAQAAADRLELHSPSKEGPMSDMDTWWEAFPETLLKPFDIKPMIGAAMNVSAPGMTGTTERVEIHLTSDGNGVTDDHLEAVARRVESILDHRYENASMSWGRRSH